MEAHTPPETAFPACPEGLLVSAAAGHVNSSAEQTGCQFGQEQRPDLDAADPASADTRIGDWHVRAIRSTPSMESAQRWHRRGERFAAWLFDQWEREHMHGHGASRGCQDIGLAFSEHRAIPLVEGRAGGLDENRAHPRPPGRSAP